MNGVNHFHQIRPILSSRVAQSITETSGIEENINDQTEEFFNSLSMALEANDPSRLDPILKSWAVSQTETDLETGESELVSFLKSIMLSSQIVCRETLSDSDALDLLDLLIPCFAYAFHTLNRFETQEKMDHNSRRLEFIQQRLEKLDRRKSEFISVAAHELKTPLTLIDGYSAMLRDSLNQMSTSDRDMELMDGITMGTRRLQSIIDDMIDVSMIDNNLLELSFQPIWINRLLTVIEIELKPKLNSRNQNLIIHIFPGCDEMTYGDPERLTQVFRNILINAIKFTPDGGSIDVNGRKLPGFVEVIISDTGIGIAQDDQDLIFDKFGRLGDSSLHSSSKTKFKGGGPGLGLHIAKGIVQAHGGSIWMESPGCDEEKCPGSTFHVLLPVHPEPPDEKTARLFAALTQQNSINLQNGET